MSSTNKVGQTLTLGVCCKMAGILPGKRRVETNDALGAGAVARLYFHTFNDLRSREMLLLHMKVPASAWSSGPLLLPIFSSHCAQKLPHQHQRSKATRQAAWEGIFSSWQFLVALTLSKLGYLMSTESCLHKPFQALQWRSGKRLAVLIDGLNVEEVKTQSAAGTQSLLTLFHSLSKIPIQAFIQEVFDCLQISGPESFVRHRFHHHHHFYTRRLRSKNH